MEEVFCVNGIEGIGKGLVVSDELIMVEEVVEMLGHGFFGKRVISGDIGYVAGAVLNQKFQDDLTSGVG